MSPVPDEPIDEVEWVSPDIIRGIFNDGQYYQKVLGNQLTAHIKKDKLLSSVPIGEPPGVRSQILYYYDQNGEPVAIVHQYVRPDGSLGGSGKPDPKKIFLEGRIIATRE